MNWGQWLSFLPWVIGYGAGAVSLGYVMKKEGSRR